VYGRDRPAWRGSSILAARGRLVWFGWPRCAPGSLSRLLLDRQFHRRCCGTDIHSQRGWFTIFAPSLQRILPCGNILDFEIAVLVGHGKIRSRSNDDIAGHFGMHIAKERGDTDIVELERFLLALRPSTEVMRELFVPTDRGPIDVVA